jgi:chitinase
MPKYFGGYHVYWSPYNESVRYHLLPQEYNLIFLFHATPTGSGRVVYNSPGGNSTADVQRARQQGRKVLVSCGGAGAGFGLDSRQDSLNFIASIQKIYNDLGGIDGIDWNNFEANQLPTTQEMIFASLELKRLYPGFLITSPCAPWRAADLQWALDMNAAGALSFAGPQWYDGPGLNTNESVMSQLAGWVNAVGQEKCMVGFGIRNGGYYWTAQQANTCLRNVLARWPNIGGIYTWEINWDIANGSTFRTLAPTLGSSQAPQQAPQQAPVQPAQAPRADSNFVFHQGKDSWDGVTQDNQLVGLSVEEMKSRCLADPSCVGFNTNGYVKLVLVDPLLNEPSFSGADQGLYVKVSRPQQVPAQPIQASQQAPIQVASSGSSQGPRGMTGTAVVNGMTVNFSATFQY